MRVVVQKYGGSSVADVARIRAVAERIVRTRESGAAVVAVVSAMGDATNELLALARSVSVAPPPRELDMLVSTGERVSMALLSMAIHDLGHSAVSFTGSQSGIITTAIHGQARVVEVRPYRIHDEVQAGKIVIVAGFQGVSYRREITTLGRGGSDTTAICLAAALRADYCEICSDVDGVYTADPRVVPQARRLAEMSHDEMFELARAGAKVLNAEAVDYARRHGVAIYARATAGPSGDPGTAVRLDLDLDRPAVTAVTGSRHLLIARPGGRSEAELERALAAVGEQERGPLRTVWTQGELELWFDVESGTSAHDLPRRLGAALPGVALEHPAGVVTAVGPHVSSDPTVALRALAALRARDLPRRGLYTGAGVLAIRTDASALDDAVRAVHAALLETGRVGDAQHRPSRDE